jgi:hypothetical protein
MFQPLCGGARSLQIEAATLRDLLRAIDLRCPGFYDRVVEDGRIRPELAIAIDGEAMTYPLHEPLGPATEVTIVPAISGG